MNTIFLVKFDTYFTRILSNLTNSSYDAVGVLNGPFIDIYSSLQLPGIHSLSDMTDCNIIQTIVTFDTIACIRDKEWSDELKNTLLTRIPSGKHIVDELLESTDLRTPVYVCSDNVGITPVHFYYEERMRTLCCMIPTILDVSLFDIVFNTTGVKREKQVESPSTPSFNIKSHKFNITISALNPDLSVVPEDGLNDIVTYVNASKDTLTKDKLLLLSTAAMKELYKRKYSRLTKK